MGSQVFEDVQVPLLWGQRAVIQDRKGRISVIYLGGERAKPEIVADRPAAGTAFVPRIDGIVVLRDGKELYTYNPKEKMLTGIDLALPECQIAPWGIRVGTNQFRGSFISGFGVGIAVTETAISLGAPLPPGLAKLAI